MGGALNNFRRKRTRLRKSRSPFAERSVLPKRLLLAGTQLLLAAGLLASISFSDGESDKQGYWKKLHEKQKAQSSYNEHLQIQRREQIKQSLDEIQRQGAAAQQELIVAEDGPPPPPPPPPWWFGRGDYIAVTLAGGLFAWLAAITLTRHRREAEIRKLSGGYLSDGTEVAKFQMPDWFAPAPQPAPQAEPEQPVVDGPVEATPIRPPDEVDEFFTEAPSTLAAIRAVIKELAGTEEPTARQQVLLQLHVLVHDISKRSNVWELRPAWQLSSALDLLIKRIADHPKDVTPSALRTASAAIDLLHELCVPGVRPNLIIDPPVRVLAADDEKLCLRALSYALEKARIPVDTAEYGAKAVMLATEKPYDVIFLDIEMPDMDGLASCKNIRATQLNADTPIVFVTVHADFAMRARSIAVGGSDFMAKPFLVFELTVKAMTLLMRKRLDVAKAKRSFLTPSPAASTTSAACAPSPEAEAVSELAQTAA